MKIFLSLYFFMIAIVQTGLFFGIFHYYRSQNLVKTGQYWLGSLFTSSVALLIFGIGILGVEDVSRPAFTFTVANFLFFLAGLLQTIFCISLNRPVEKKLMYVSLIFSLAFISFFEFLRLTSTFEARTMFMVAIASTFYVIQIYQIRITRGQDQSKQLVYLQTVTAIELMCALGRLAVLLITGFGVKSVEQLPQFLILFTLAQLVMNTLSYIAIAGYKSEQISYAKAKSDAAREAAETKVSEMSELLKEKERLIYGLLKANKTAATGALSASIAHELNQPLGASSLNIQFLQKKLAEGQINPELQAEILNTLLADNQRAANIIRTLRSVFADEKIESSRVELGALISEVLAIAKPEIVSKKINVRQLVNSNIILQTNRSEIQQVILNLLNNSIQALAISSESNKEIQIETSCAENSVQISISDNGDGILKHAQTQLFELLVESKKKGMGLGLWLCKHIVMRHGGSIRYEDNLPKGAKFVINLPLESKSA